MTLNPHPSFPAHGAYVLKLHRDARPQQGHLRGRLEHIASGATTDFADTAALIEWLSRHATALAADTTRSTPL